MVEGAGDYCSVEARTESWMEADGKDNNDDDNDDDL